MKLSPHFTLRELTRTAHRRVDNSAPEHIVDRLRTLCREYLEPAREQFGPLWITSGYRCPELNAAIGGSKTSAHMFGCAADFISMREVPTIEIVDWIVDLSGLDFDQVIDEYSSTANWVHLGILRPVGPDKPRRQALTMRGGRYLPFDRGVVA